MIFLNIFVAKLFTLHQPSAFWDIKRFKCFFLCLTQSILYALTNQWEGLNLPMQEKSMIAWASISTFADTIQFVQYLHSQLCCNPAWFCLSAFQWWGELPARGRCRWRGRRARARWACTLRALCSDQAPGTLIPGDIIPGGIAGRLQTISHAPRPILKLNFWQKTSTWIHLNVVKNNQEQDVYF